jgi:hypothetical protein
MEDQVERNLTMRKLLAFALVLSLAATAMAYDITDISKGDKPFVQYPENVPVRQGGDTILDAVLITLPVANMTGTTAGYTNDYDEVCNYTGSTSPDVVYTFTPAASMGYDFDMLGSAYDTKIYIYDENLALVACNDDFYSDYTSFLENVPVVAGVQYFLVIDGYGLSFGNYLLNIREFVPCIIDCPAGAQIEGEPTIVDGYIDNFNGGCNSTPVVYSPLDCPEYCGKLGYYVNATGGNSRDLDWLEAEIPAGGVLEIIGDAAEAMNLYQIEGTCDNLIITNGGVAGPCNEFTLTITGAAGSVVRILCGPIHFWEGSTYEYDYLLLSNLVCIIGTEDHTWTDVKSLFE